MKTRFATRVLLIIVFISCLPGCESYSEALYSWGTYELQVYAHLKGESPLAQIQALERDRQKIESSGKSIPPGFYAHLGLLYAETGDEVMAVECFLTERMLFPESAVFIDFLLRRHSK